MVISCSFIVMRPSSFCFLCHVLLVSAVIGRQSYYLHSRPYGALHFLFNEFPIALS